MRRGKKLLSFAASLLLLASLLLPLITPGKAHADPGPPGQTKWSSIPITTCQQLQDINNDLTATYTLSNNLNCTGFGFITIGEDGSGVPTGSFEGRLYGQGHTISGLDVSLFRSVVYGVVANLNLSSSLSFSASHEVSGFLAKQISAAVVSDVHVTGAATMNWLGVGVGGLVGSATNVSIIRSSAVVSMGGTAGSTEYGGLVLYGDNVQIRDSYAVSTMAISTMSVEHAGGLLVYGVNVSITNSYASGTIDVPGNIHEIGGLAWYNQGTGAHVTNSFSTLQGVGLCNGGQSCTGLVTFADDSLDLSSDYFDQTVVGTSLCTSSVTNTICHRVNTDGSQSNYFNSNSTNPPLNGWDFSSTWVTTAGLPTLRSFSNPSPQPGPVAQLTTSIGSPTAVNLNWALPASTGSAPLLAEQVNYQKVGETTWQKVSATDINSYSSSATNFSGTSLAVTGLLPNTSYNFEVVLYNQDGYFSTATATGVTATPGFAVINTCQQLQDVTNGLYDNYELGRNIDCSDSINWGGGQGFVPIGCNSVGGGSYGNFFGTFEGNNYTISNIHVDGGSMCNAKAIFGATNDALIQDVNIVNPVIKGSASNNYSNAVLVSTDKGSTLSNIHISGDVLGDDNLIIAGLVAITSGTAATNISRVSFTGSINAQLTTVGGFGGLIGYQQAPAVISDSYAQINITDVSSYAYGGYIGGLVAYSSASINVTHSYASLNFDGSGSVTADGTLLAIGGLIGYTPDTAPTLTGNFARTQIVGFSGNPVSFGGMVGVISNSNPGGGSPPIDFSGNYFDADLIGTNQCAGSLVGGDSIYAHPATCTAISGQPNYFNNNSTNPPLDSWDFNNIWEITSTLPVFGRKVLTTVTPIPANRLVSRRPKTASRTTIPAQTVAPQPVKISTLPRAKARVTASSTPSAPQGIIAQLRRLVSRVPAVVLVNFPYALFGLLLLAALALLIEVARQTKRLQHLNLLLEKQRSVAEKRDTFWHLAANYLRAPITLLMGGADLLALSKLDSREAHQLTTLSQRLQTKVASIMHQIEHSRTLQNIKTPAAEKPHRVWRSVGFWLPVVTVAILMVLTDYVAQSWRDLHLSTISLTTQALAYLLAALALYWVLSALGLVSRRRRNAERLLQQQSQALDAARLRLMRQTATELDADVNHLQTVLLNLSSNTQAKPIMQEGASRLRHLVDSFQLLISAQNHRLGGLSPAGAHTNLDHVLKSSVAELEPKITAKNLTVRLPAQQRLQVPGNADLNSQVVSSILSNAIAFSPSGSTIRVRVEQTDSGTHLQITDHGPGITPAQQAHLFEPFTKADGQTGLQLDHDGLGINLYLDRQIMNYLGGHIGVESTPGQGMTVELVWPQTTGSAAYPGTLVHPQTSVA